MGGAVERERCRVARAGVASRHGAPPRRRAAAPAAMQIFGAQPPLLPPPSPVPIPIPPTARAGWRAGAWVTDAARRSAGHGRSDMDGGRGRAHQPRRCADGAARAHGPASGAPGAEPRRRRPRAGRRRAAALGVRHRRRGEPAAQRPAARGRGQEEGEDHAQGQGARALQAAHLLPLHLLRPQDRQRQNVRAALPPRLRAAQTPVHACARVPGRSDKRKKIGTLNCSTCGAKFQSIVHCTQRPPFSCLPSGLPLPSLPELLAWTGARGAGRMGSGRGAGRGRRLKLVAF